MLVRFLFLFSGAFFFGRIGSWSYFVCLFAFLFLFVACNYHITRTYLVAVRADRLFFFSLEKKIDGRFRVAKRSYRFSRMDHTE